MRILYFEPFKVEPSFTSEVCEFIPNLGDLVFVAFNSYIVGRRSWNPETQTLSIYLDYDKKK